MKRISLLTLLIVGVLTSLPVQAALEIVRTNSAENPVWMLKDSSSEKILGTFWDSEKRTSDFGYEGRDDALNPLWSKDRNYVAVNGGAARSQSVFLYKMEGDRLTPIEVPALDEKQAAPLTALHDTIAEGIETVRWQEDGRLLLHFWAADRVTSDTEKQKTADVWADLEVSGDQARIVRTSSEAGDSPRNENSMLVDPSLLEGVHEVTGRNPDGKKYSGKVEIRVKNGLLLMEWRIGKQVSHGTGLFVGMTLGVALDSGLAIYKFFGQSEGQSLIGFWSAQGSKATNEEAILIGNADMTQAAFPVEKINGSYLSLREVGDAQEEGRVTISGGDVAKKVLWKLHGKQAKCQGLALSDGLAIISPEGLSVFERQPNAQGEASFEGSTVTGKGTISQETLITSK